MDWTIATCQDCNIQFNEIRASRAKEDCHPVLQALGLTWRSAKTINQYAHDDCGSRFSHLAFVRRFEREFR